MKAGHRGGFNQGQRLKHVVSSELEDDIAMTEDAPRSDTPTAPVDIVIKQLGDRLVAPPDRGRLRRALDDADAPLKGRPGADEALGRVTQR